jgi:plastocyanin/mono/diheme cytochrome c family protein
MNRERIAAALVIAPMVAIAAAVAWYSRASVPGFAEPEVKVFNLTGVGWEGVWTADDVTGVNYWWRRFEPATLHLEVGDEVVLNLHSADLYHQFYMPQFGVGPVDVKPGRVTTVRFTADRAGVFQYYCTSMCGGCHFYMRGWVVVTAPGETPIEPPAITCPLCLPDLGPPPPRDDLVAYGAYLYLEKGCITCHGPEGHGGVTNPNSANSPVPAHNTTAQKLFLASPDDAEAFIELLRRCPGLARIEGDPEISRFPVVQARFENARTIIRGGRYSSKLDPQGPEPPLQMPAWQYLVDEREIDALLAYFVSLYPWEEEGW